MSDSENDTERKLNSDSSSGGGSDSDSDNEQQATKSNTASDQERTTFSDSDEEGKNSQDKDASGQAENLSSTSNIDKSQNVISDDDSDEDINKKPAKTDEVDQKSGSGSASSSDEDDDGPKDTKKSLFGEMSSDESDNDAPRPKMDSDSDEGPTRSPTGSPKRRGFSSPKSDDEQKQEETRIEVQIPKINTNLGDNIHFVRFPNFLSVEPRPFDAEFYEDEAEEDDELDEEGRTRLKLKVENTIRWRKIADASGNETTQSNARIVKWSDGTQSLIVGNEKFDMNTMPLIGDFNHLFIRQGTGLQGQAVFKTKLTFRPYSTNSLTHRKMMGRLAHRINHSIQKVKVIPVTTVDPTVERLKMVKQAEEESRAEARREAMRQKMREKQLRKGISAGYLEDQEDDDNSYSLNAIKNRYRNDRTPNRDDASSSEDESHTNRRGSYAGVAGIESSDEDDNDENRKRSRNPSQDSAASETKKPKRKVIDDSDDDEETERRSQKSNSDKNSDSDNNSDSD